MNQSDAVALLEGRLDDALSRRDVAGERVREEASLLAENAGLREQLEALRAQMETMRAAHRAEVASLAAEANVDALTGALNRRGFDQAVDRELSRARGSTVSALLIDVDFFKGVNDAGGHAFGDSVLKKLGGILLSANRREGDVVGRIGGEEFAVVMPASLETARQRAEMLREILAAREVSRPDGSPLTVGIGIAAVEDLMAKREALLDAADTALYRAKRGGRNRVVAIDDPDDALSMINDVDDPAELEDGADFNIVRELASEDTSEFSDVGETQVMPHVPGSAAASLAGGVVNTALGGIAAAHGLPGGVATELAAAVIPPVVPRVRPRMAHE